MGAKNAKVIKKKRAPYLFPKIQSEKLLMLILESLLPHEIIQVQYVNTYIYSFINDDLVWKRLCRPSLKRLHCFDEESQCLILIYPMYKSPLIKLPVTTGKVKTEFPENFHSVETFDHRLLVLGGKIMRNKKSITSSSVYEFKERRLKFIEKERMTYPKHSLRSCVFEDELYTLGGYDDDIPQNTMERYTPHSNTWISKQSSPISIKNGQVISFANIFIYIFEPKKTQEIDVYKYNRRNNTWININCKIQSLYNVDRVILLFPIDSEWLLLKTNETSKKTNVEAIDYPEELKEEEQVPIEEEKKESPKPKRPHSKSFLEEPIRPHSKSFLESLKNQSGILILGGPSYMLFDPESNQCTYESKMYIKWKSLIRPCGMLFRNKLFVLEKNDESFSETNHFTNQKLELIW